jgi:prepilin-type processing-associated H-X9-DG protein
MSGALYNNAWFQFSWMSNEVRSPKVLACPSDIQKRPASNWGMTPDGFLHASLRDAALSYFVGLDVFTADRAGLVSGDRNVLFNFAGGACSSGVTYNSSLNSPGSTGIGGGLHVEAGNFLFGDGSVEQLSSQGFVARVSAMLGAQDNGSAHYLRPNSP